MARRIVTETSCDHCRRQTDVASYRVGNGVRLLRIELCPECGEYLDEHAVDRLRREARRQGRTQAVDPGRDRSRQEGLRADEQAR